MSTQIRHGRAWLAWAAALGALGLAGGAQAHHSFSVFDMEHEKTIEGDIVEFQWTNPHTWTWLNVKNADGSVTRWGLEGMSPNYLGRRGWSKGTFKPGDHVKAVILPLKSGEPGGTLLRATLPDGKEVVNFGRPPGGGPPPQE
ncbi:MAG TPA: DUF6152 family protein [Gammaproteobacteria bacterium]|jgi:hypothetical protein|nr:DUF6152 family protein [Gammaproteobacteria bacterium]